MIANNLISLGFFVVPKNDTVRPFYKGINFNYLQKLSGITVLIIGDIYEKEIRPHND